MGAVECCCHEVKPHWAHHEEVILEPQCAVAADEFRHIAIQCGTQPEPEDPNGDNMSPGAGHFRIQPRFAGRVQRQVPSSACWTCCEEVPIERRGRAQEVSLQWPAQPPGLELEALPRPIAAEHLVVKDTECPPRYSVGDFCEVINDAQNSVQTLQPDVQDLRNLHVKGIPDSKLSKSRWLCNLHGTLSWDQKIMPGPLSSSSVITAVQRMVVSFPTSKVTTEEQQPSRRWCRRRCGWVRRTGSSNLADKSDT